MEVPRKAKPRRKFRVNWVGWSFLIWLKFERSCINGLKKLFDSKMRDWTSSAPKKRGISLVTENVVEVSEVLGRVRLIGTPWTAARQAPLSMGFSRQGYGSGVPCPPPGDLLDPGIEPASLTPPALAGGFFTTGATWLLETATTQ